MDKRKAFLYLAIFILNLIDGIFTYYFISLGVEELNPLMRILLNNSVFSFFVIKILLVSLGLFILYRLTKSNIILYFILATYLLVDIFHIIGGYIIIINN